MGGSEMYEEYRVGVVIPMYNEEQFVDDVLTGQPAFVDRVYAVDDCSTDGTWAEIQRHAATESHPTDVTTNSHVANSVSPDGGHRQRADIVPIQHDHNRGRGGAVKTGYKAALNDEMDIVAVMDGDGQMDPAILDRFLDPIVAGEADYTKGDRLATPALREQMSNWRLFGNVLLTGLTRVASGYWEMSDPQNGYTAISRDALERIDVDDLYEDYGFLNDILVHLNVHDADVIDVPTAAHYGEEESGIRYRSFVPLLTVLLLSRFLWRLRLKW